MSNKDAVLIGGGYGGIATGIYLQQQGFTTLICEQSSLPGGVSTAWRRGAYLFDGATNWVAGSSLTSFLHTMMSEVISFEDLSFIYPEEFIEIHYQGEHFTVYSDLDRLRQEMTRIAPEDASHINHFIQAIEERKQVSIPFDTPPDMATLRRKIFLLLENRRFFTSFLKWKSTSVRSFAQKFRNPNLREMFLRMFPHHEGFSMFAVISTLAWHSLSAAGYPVGGSERLLEVLIEKYRALGGEYRLKSPVASVQIEDDTARGVVLKDGKEITAHRVIAACDGMYTAETLLQGNYRNRGLEKKLKKPARTYPGLFQLSLGVKGRLTGLRHKYNIELSRPVRTAASEMCSDMMVRVCPASAGFAPAGHTVLIVHQRIDDVEYWINLRKRDRDAYEREKERLKDVLLREVENFFGPLEIERSDTATPATYVRYTNIYRASYQGWQPTPSEIGNDIPATFEGLNNFYLTGQWVAPAGGITGVIRVGRHLCQHICREEGIPFSHD
ncbi:MAG: phytoene desaturase family protein [Fibrobacterota bacterium]